MFLFILGRQPEIARAELSAVFGAKNLLKISGQKNLLALKNYSRAEILSRANFLGSIIKIAEIIPQEKDFRATIFAHFAEISGKITLGISDFSGNSSANSAQKIAREIKNILNKNSVRIIPNENSELSSAAVLHNNLARGNLKKQEIIFVNSAFLARTIFVQNIENYAFRDRARPRRDARVGMLPPKLAQIIINLTGANKISNHENLEKNREKNEKSQTLILDEIRRKIEQHSEAHASVRRASSGNFDEEIRQNQWLLDPFCGTGVILQEAGLMNFRVFGTDIEPRMIDFSRENLDFFAAKFHRDFPQKLEVGDATNFSWQKSLENDVKKSAEKIGKKFDEKSENSAKNVKNFTKKSEKNREINFVATETYLGRAYTSPPNLDNLRENIENCNVILTKFLQNLREQISCSTGICVAAPCWFLQNREFHLPLISKLTAIGFEQIFYSDEKTPLIYHRENQIVGRELLVLRKKS